MDESQDVASVRAAITEAMGHGRLIQTLSTQIEAVARSDYSVVVEGETGAGKEVVARALHRHSSRAARPFVTVDCGAIIESLTQSEFFGHEKGAYTGAHDRRRGLFEAAGAGGTIFLDEVGNLASTAQKALLRALEERTIRRLGAVETVAIDIRIIAATNENLEERVKAGMFREDLLFRLAEYVIVVPPLRSRPEDVEFLARRFLTQARKALGRPPVDIAPTALDRLRRHHWPGNVRELRNVMRRAALVAADAVTPRHLDESLGDGGGAWPGRTPNASPALSLRETILTRVRKVERDAVLAALEEAGGNKAKAARLLGIDYKTYRTKLKSVNGDVTDDRN